MDHTVAVGGRRRVVDDIGPFAGLLVLGLLDLGHHFLFKAAFARSDSLFHRLQNRAKRQLGVSQYGHIGLVLLIQVMLVGIHMNQAHALGYGASIGAVGQPVGVAHCQHHVGLPVHVHRGPAGVAAAGIATHAHGERMIFGKDALGHQSGSHRHRQQFSQFFSLVPGLGG